MYPTRPLCPPSDAVRPVVSRMTSRPQFRQIVRSDLSTPEVADLAAFTFLEDAAVKQSLLAEGDVRRRVRTTVEALELFARGLPAVLKVRRPIDPSVN